jgi:hypothetical protein
MIDQHAGVTVHRAVGAQAGHESRRDTWRAPLPASPPGLCAKPSTAPSGRGRRLPIFESVKSDWSRHNATDFSGEEQPVSWTSAADAGWRAADVEGAGVQGAGVQGAGVQGAGVQGVDGAAPHEPRI